MHKDEFELFMKHQILAIQEYREKHQKNSCDTNECVFEWIKNNAANFRKDWHKNNF